jgi:hypothetical protein
LRFVQRLHGPAEGQRRALRLCVIHPRLGRLWRRRVRLEKSWKEIAKDFPDRTQEAVKTRGLKQLKLKRDDSDAAA